MVILPDGLVVALATFRGLVDLVELRGMPDGAMGFVMLGEPARSRASR